MSELPAGWAEAPLGQLGDEIRGSIVPVSGAAYELYSVPTFPTLRPEIIDGSEIGSAKRPVRPDDVLLCKINPRINRVWVVADPLESGRTQIASTEYLTLRVHDPDLSRYLMWYLRSPEFRDWIKLSVEGATGSHTRAKSGPILRQLMPIPPLNEQRRIVAALEEQLSRLDAADASLATAEIRTRLFRDSVLESAFTNGAPRQTIGSIASLTDGPFGSNLKTSHYVDEGPRVVRLQNIGNGVFRDERAHITSEHYSALTKHAVVPGDVVVASLGEEAPRACLVPDWLGEAIVKADCIRLRCHDGVDPSYVMWALNSRPVKAHAATRIKGIGRPRLGLGGIRDLELPVPPFEEQRRIVAEVEEQLSRIDAMRASIERAQRRSAALRASILERAFRGELVPQDPSDEPAPALLARIRAERDTAGLANRRTGSRMRG